MSDVSTENQSAEMGAMDIEMQAADWVMERHNGKTWSESDQVQLGAWLAYSLAHRVAYIRLDATWRRTNRLAALRLSAPNATSLGTIHRGGWLRVIGAMAVFLVIALAGGGVFIFSAPRERTFATGLGERQTVTLADGSQIELNTDTALRTIEDEGVRVVLLDRGEAFFQVKHDAGRKFVVIADGHRITDLGTKFLIRDDTNRLQVALLEGRAEVEPIDGRKQTQSTILSPGDFAVATAKSISVTKKSTQALTDAIAWRQGDLVFHFTSLADAAAEFNRYNGIKIVVTDPSVARRQIGGTFATSDVALFGRVARDLLGVRVEDRDAEVVISR